MFDAAGIVQSMADLCLHPVVSRKVRSPVHLRTGIPCQHRSCPQFVRCCYSDTVHQQKEGIRSAKWLSRRDLFRKKVTQNLVLHRSAPLDCQLLQAFPTKELLGKVVMVRCDLNVSIEDDGGIVDRIALAIPTIAYLSEMGCKVVLASHWAPSKTVQDNKQMLLIADAISCFLKQDVFLASGAVGEEVEKDIGSLSNGQVLLLGNLRLHKGEEANDPEFAKALTVKIDHLVNDAFRVSHRVLASTVGAATFTCARLAGLQLAEELGFAAKIFQSAQHPFVAIIGGGKVSEKLEVLRQLLDRCEKIFITGRMVFTFLEAAGFPVSSCVEKDMLPKARELLKKAAIKLILPTDLMLGRESAWNITCNMSISHPVPDGWLPVDLGKDSLEYIKNSVQESKTILWLGPCGIGGGPAASANGKLFLAKVISRASLNGCLTVAGGKDVIKALKQAGAISTISHVFQNGAAFWQLLKGHVLPGVSALDPASPAPPDWNTAFKDPCLPLTVDIGCGNGLFILRMARKFLHRNFLGLEIFSKLVERCSVSGKSEQLLNTHFITANATTSFDILVCSYPGKVDLIAIQCPDPNFNKQGGRWRMVQRRLVEAVSSMLSRGGKVFLQSDVKGVLDDITNEFQLHSGGRLNLSSEHFDPRNCDEYGWLNYNPLEASTDWEDHVLERGRRMYRVLLSKT